MRRWRVFFLGLVLAALISLWIMGERGRLILPSTIASTRVGGLRRSLNLTALDGYIYGRWTNQYIKVLMDRLYPRMGDRAKRFVRNRYHAKLLTQEQAEKIILLDKPIDRRDLEQVIPYPMARDLVIGGPPDVVAYECACRHRRPNHCEPTQVCMIVGKPFSDFILEHNPQSSRRLTQSEAIQLLRDERDRGHLHSAWFKDACTDRFYAICNCCKCCCGGIEAMMKYGNPLLASSGYVAQVDDAACLGCSTCEAACPFDAIEVNGVAHVEWDKCMGCGVCESQCPEDAITLARDEAKGVPLDVTLLQAELNEAI